MIEVHVTRKLHQHLPVDAQGYLPYRYRERRESSGNALSHWHANLMFIQRRKCVLFVHEQTRFPLFLRSLVKADFENLDELFEDSLMNTLLKVGAGAEHLAAAERLLAPLRYDTRTSRSPLGTLNQRGQEIKHMIMYRGLSLEDVNDYRAGAWLAETPVNNASKKQCIWPVDAMLTCLSQSH